MDDGQAGCAGLCVALRDCVTDAAGGEGVSEYTQRGGREGRMYRFPPVIRQTLPCSENMADNGVDSVGAVWRDIVW